MLDVTHFTTLLCFVFRLSLYAYVESENQALLSISHSILGLQSISWDTADNVTHPRRLEPTIGTIDGLQYNAMSAMLEVYNKRIFYSSNCWLQPAWVGDIRDLTL